MRSPTEAPPPANNMFCNAVTHLLPALLVGLLLPISTTFSSPTSPLPQLFTWDAVALHTLRNTLSQPSPLSSLSVSQTSALRHLSDQATRWQQSLHTSTFPIITNKSFIPPGATLQHFVSLVPYAHECTDLPAQCVDYKGQSPASNSSYTCDRETGLPWVICDGLLNHAAKFNRTDRPALEQMMHAVIRLSLRAYLFRDSDAAHSANVVMDTWFVNNSTRMLPSLRFAQGVPGVTDGKPSGCIDLSLFGRGFSDAVALLSQTPEAEWDSTEGRARSVAFRQWCASMADEMLHNERINAEMKMRNNHGIYYDLTVLSLSLLAHHPLFPLPQDDSVQISTLAKTISLQSYTLKESSVPMENVPTTPFISSSAIDSVIIDVDTTQPESTSSPISVKKNAKTVSSLRQMLAQDCVGWVRCVKGRLDDQTDSTGAQIHELDRVGFGHYVWYTLLAHVHLYTTARSAGAALPLRNSSTSLNPEITPVLRIAHWTLRNFDRLTGTQGDEWLVYGAQAYRIISRLTGESIYEVKACELLREMHKYSRTRRDKNYFLWHDIRIGMDVWNLALPSIDISKTEGFQECEVWKDFPTTMKKSSLPSPASPTSNSIRTISSSTSKPESLEFPTLDDEPVVAAESLISSSSSLHSSATNVVSNFTNPLPLNGRREQAQQLRSVVIRELYNSTDAWWIFIRIVWVTAIVLTFIWAFLEAVHQGRPHHTPSTRSSQDGVKGLASSSVYPLNAMRRYVTQK